ncbi:hypothetical protein QSV97_002354 [Listeria monocytogenes]|nr:hypothetical protein [Listeria monocytogenes]EKZ3957047.1 hypothetical protein [Listeria monocytogenes]
MNEQKAKAIVLEYLKEFHYPGICSLKYFFDDYKTRRLPDDVYAAYRKVLSGEIDCELLAEFAAWGLKEGAKG